MQNKVLLRASLRMPTSIVSVTKDNPLAEMVARSLEAVKFSKILEKRGGESVIVKPNFADVGRIAPLDYKPDIAGGKGQRAVGLPRRGDQTSTEILEAIVKTLRDYSGVREIVIAEASATPTWKAYFMYGIYDLAQKHHVRLVDLNNDEAEAVSPPGAQVLKTVFTPRTIAKANIVISVPVLKIWRACGVSISLKNMAGGTVPRYYAPQICRFIQWSDRPIFNPDTEYGQSKTLAAGIVDIASMNRAHISIVDALTVMHNAHPGKEFSFRYEDVKVEDFGGIISGSDMVATDAVGAELMGFDAKRILHLNVAKERGLGTNDMSEIELTGINLDSVKMKCTPMAGMEEIVK